MMTGGAHRFALADLEVGPYEPAVIAGFEDVEADLQVGPGAPT
jgi:hypothetical protein